MTVPNVSFEEIVEPDWGNQVADDVNDLLGRTAALEGIGAGGRLAAAESNITTLQGQAAACGIWRQADNQFVNLGPTKLWFSVPIWGDNGVTHNSGNFTVTRGGIYIAQAFLTSSSGVITNLEWRINGGAAGNVLGGQLMWAVGPGTVFTFWATGTSASPETVCTGGHLMFWRVSP